MFDGKEFRRFEARRTATRSLYHLIFTKSGEGEATLTVEKKEGNKTVRVTFPFPVNSRKSIAIP
jgi:hypothetical protein